MAHFNFVISQNAKWGHACFYIDVIVDMRGLQSKIKICVPENILLQKKHWV